MKAQHRKELHTNALADRLGRMVEVFKNPQEGPSTSVLVGLGILLVVVACVLGWMWYDRHSQQVTSAENKELDLAQSREDYKKLADAHPNTPAGRIARLQLSRMSLKEGLDQLYVSNVDDRAAARERLEEAKKYYADLIRDCRDDAILVQECLMGQGKVQESLGDFDDALATYRKLQNDYKDSFLTEEADEHVKLLEDPKNREKVQKFYQELNALADGKSLNESK